MSESSAGKWFDQAVEAHLAPLYRYGLHLCRGRVEDAEDLIQDAVLRALRNIGQIRDRGAAKAWLFRIVTTTHLNRVRAAGRRAETLAGDLDDGAFEEALAAWTPINSIEDELLRALDHQQLRACVDALPLDLRAALWLADVEDFSQREVAEMLAIPEGTVASRVFRARRTLRTRLSETIADAPELSRRER